MLLHAIGGMCIGLLFAILAVGLAYIFEKGE
jgi:tetrahydromethanopterin S-methyltransferase subunit F